MEREFFISDLHFDHKNIIRYCNRPFSSVDEMNHFIVNTWNRTVDLGDTVYFLGDHLWRGNRKIGYWKIKSNPFKFPAQLSPQASYQKAAA